MMPQLLSVRVSRPGHRRIWIPLPVLPAMLLLSPILFLALLAGAFACLMFHVNAARALGTAWHIVCALPGTRFEIEQDRTAVLVAVR